VQERKDVKDKSGVLHTVGDVAHDFGKHESFIFGVLLPFLDYFFFFLVSYISGERNHYV